MVHVNRIFTSQPCRYALAMASLNRSCSLCRADITVKHAIRIKDDLASRISALLDVVVDLEDKLPQYICPKCKRRLVSLKNTAEDLVDFRELAKRCQSALKLQRGPLKRTKESSSDLGVSPDIIKARPPVKRSTSTCRSLDFGQCKCRLTNCSAPNSMTMNSSTLILMA